MPIKYKQKSTQIIQISPKPKRKIHSFPVNAPGTLEQRAHNPGRPDLALSRFILLNKFTADCYVTAVYELYSCLEVFLGGGGGGHWSVRKQPQRIEFEIVFMTFCKTYKSTFYCHKYHQTKWRVHTPSPIITVQK